jgi:hypothetical protein
MWKIDGQVWKFSFGRKEWRKQLFAKNNPNFIN